MTQINTIITYLSNNWILIYKPVFQKGMLTGAVLIIFVLIILKILLFSCRKKEIKCNGITGKSDDGEVFISSAAISDLVKSLEPEFIGVSISKSVLYKYGKNHYIRLIAELNDKEADFNNMISNIRNKILLSVKSNLGIETITKVDIHLKRVKG